MAAWLITLETGFSETVVAAPSANGASNVPGCENVDAAAGVTAMAVGAATEISLQEIVVVPLEHCAGGRRGQVHRRSEIVTEDARRTATRKQVAAGTRLAVPLPTAVGVSVMSKRMGSMNGLLASDVPVPT